MRILALPRDFPTADRPQDGQFVLRQIQALQALGHTIRAVRIVPMAPPLSPKWRAYGRIPETYVYEGVAVRTVRVVVPPRMLGINLVRAQASAALREEIEKFGPEVLHAHCVLPTAAMARDLGVPSVITAHGSDAYSEPWRRSDLRKEAVAAVACATEVVAVSGFVKEAVAALGRPDAAVVFNGADERIFSPTERSAVRARMGIDAARPVVVYAGNLLTGKGIYDLADALAAIADLRPLALVAGEGPEAAGLHARLETLRVEHRMLGRISQREVAAVLGAAHAFALPSHAEGLPVAICEAMLSGRTVVASRVGGIPEIIHDGITGVLVPRADPLALALALRRVLTNAAERGGLERNAHAFALQHLTWRANAAAYDALYRRAVARYGRAFKSA